MSISAEERSRLKERRLELEWRQEDLATRTGYSPATISNLESGRSGQVRRVVYAKVVRALKLGHDAPSAPGPTTDETYHRIVQGAVDLDEQTLRAVAAFIDQMKSKKPT